MKYILYIDVQYPTIVSAFFKLFDSADGSDVPKFIKDGTYQMKSSIGFFSHELDSLFLRNSN